VLSVEGDEEVEAAVAVSLAVGGVGTISASGNHSAGSSACLSVGASSCDIGVCSVASGSDCELDGAERTAELKGEVWMREDRSEV